MTNQSLTKISRMIAPLGTVLPPKSRNRRLAILGVVLAVLFLGRMELTISGEFSVFPTHNADIRSAVDGLIAEIYVREGDWVEAGAPIARLADREYQARRQEVAATLARSRANLRLLLAGTRSEETDLASEEVATARTRLAYSSRLFEEAKRQRGERIAKAESAVGRAQNQLSFAQGELSRLESLRDQGIITEKRYAEMRQAVKIRHIELAEAEADLANTKADDLATPAREMALAKGGLQEATAKLGVLVAGTRPERLEAAEAEVAEAEALLRLADEQLALTLITSPESGIVVTPRVHENEGRMVRQGDLIAEVYDYSTVLAEILVPEKEFADVAVGQEVVLKARAYPGETFRGSVTAIAPRAVASEDGLGRQMIRVTTEINNPGLLLKPDLTGNGKIYAGKRTIFGLLSRRFIRYLRVEFWSWW